MVVFVSDLFVKDYIGGGELSTQSLIETCLLPVAQINSRFLTIEIMNEHKDAHWVFGNFSELKLDCLLYAIKNLDYSILEYDYKFCKYRSPEKHIVEEGSCNCETEQTAKAVTMFMMHAQTVWWMSHNQMQNYLNKFDFMKKANNKVLNSMFSEQTLNYITSLEYSKKNNKYLILNSN